MTTPNNFRVKNGLTVGNGIVVEAGGITVGGTTLNATPQLGNTQITNLTVTGNTEMTGQVTTGALKVGANSLVLNSNWGPSNAASQNILITINRGSSGNVAITWDESSDGWAFGNYPISAKEIALTSGLVNSTIYTGTANNANYLNGQSASYYTDATNLSTGYIPEARLTFANDTVRGAVLVIDSVANGATTGLAAAPNSVKTAYLAAQNAYTNAVSFATTAAGTAYTNAAAYTDTKSSAAYTNAVAVAATAYSNATAFATTAAGTAYTNAAAYADTKAGTAYSNAIAVAANATNLTSGTVAPARLPQANSTSNGAVLLLDSVGNTSISVYAATANSVKTAYDAAISAQTLAGTAYTNAVTVASNATNLSSGTVSRALLPQANTTANGAVIFVDSVANTAVSIYAPTANAVKTAYDAAIVANTNAATALTAAGSAYTNATTYASNASNLSTGTVAIGRIPVLDAVNNTSVSYVASANSVKTAYDAAITANTNAATALTAAGSAYSNAVTYAGTIAGTAYTNAITVAAVATNLTSGTVNPARLPQANTTANGAVILLDSVANTSVAVYAPTANAVKTAYDAAIAANTLAAAANTAAGAAYSNAVTYAGTIAGTAYTNAIAIAANATNLTSGTVAEARLPYRMNQNVRTTDAVEFTGVTINGNLTITGTQTVLGGNVTSFSDNMVYLNNGVNATITNISGSGTVVTFTANNNYSAGWDVTVTGVTPSSYNGTYQNILAANATHFQVSNTNTASYTSGGTARGKTDQNPDVGLAFGYNDGSYHHAGFFRDATDGIFKVFDNYGPEPDDSIYIDTANTTFHIADFQANTMYLGNTSAWGTVNSTAFSGTANNASYLGGTAASGYQTTAGLSGNVATLASNNASYLGGTAAASYVLKSGTTFTGAVNGITTLGTGNTTITGFANVTSTIQGGAGLTIAGAASGITTLAAGNTTITGFANVTSTIQGGAGLTIAGAASGITTLAAGNTTITGFVSVNNLYANGSGGQSVKATTTGSAQGERSAISMYGTFTGSADNGPRRVADITAGYVGGAWGNETLTFNIGYGGGANDNANTNIQRLQANSTSFVANNLAFSGITTLAAGNTTITGFANVSSTLQVGGVTTHAANVAMANNYITAPVLQSYSEYISTNSNATGAVTLDLSTSNFFNLTLTGAVTLTFSNAPASRMFAFTIVAKQNGTGGYAITWPTGTKWPGGSAPPATTTANHLDVWSVMTYDGGTTWIASLSVKDAA